MKFEVSLSSWIASSDLWVPHLSDPEPHRAGRTAVSNYYVYGPAHTSYRSTQEKKTSRARLTPGDPRSLGSELADPVDHKASDHQQGKAWHRHQSLPLDLTLASISSRHGTGEINSHPCYPSPSWPTSARQAKPLGRHASGASPSRNNRKNELM